MDTDFSNKLPLQQVREKLQELNTKNGFDWLTPIVSVTLSEYVREQLQRDPPDPTRYSPFQVNENIASANDLVNKCLARRTDIYDLEAAAINAALSYQQEITQLEPESRLYEIQVESNLAQLGRQLTDPIKEDLAQRHDAKVERVVSRLALHNLPGGSLNYGEQARFMRKIFADNISTILERIYAITEGIRICYKIDRESLPPLPDTKDQRDDLDEIVFWLRAVEEGIEDIDARGGVQFIHMPVLRQSVLEGHTLGTVLQQFWTTGLAELDVTEEVLGKHGLSAYRQGMALRVVGLSVGIVANRQMQRSTEKTPAADILNAGMDNLEARLNSVCFSCSVFAPEQEITWGAQPECLGLIPIAYSDSVTKSMSMREAGLIFNFNPIGRWQVQIGPESLSRMANIDIPAYSLSELYSYLPDMTYNPGLEVYLCLAVASN